MLGKLLSNLSCGLHFLPPPISRLSRNSPPPTSNGTCCKVDWLLKIGTNQVEWKKEDGQEPGAREGEKNTQKKENTESHGFICSSIVGMFFLLGEAGGNDSQQTSEGGEKNRRGEERNKTREIICGGNDPWLPLQPYRAAALMHLITIKLQGEVVIQPWKKDRKLDAPWGWSWKVRGHHCQSRSRGTATKGP